MPRDAVLDLIKAHLAEALAENQRTIDRHLFAGPLVRFDGTLPGVRPVSRWRRRTLALRWYVQTLWRALCGVPMTRDADLPDCED